MTSTLVKGQNAALPGGPVVVTVEVAAPADLSALMVTESGKVRSDADFIFFNQPTGPGVRCLAPESGLGWRISIDPSQVPAQIAQIRTVITLEETSKRFGSIAAPVARVSDARGNVLVDYTISGLGAESIVIALEIYRRGSDWKVRAVGQGYAGGFAALVTDHGVSVDDAPAPATPAPAPVAGHPPPSAPAASGYPPPAAPAVPGYPPPPGYPPAPGYQAPATPAVPGYPPPPGYPPAPGYQAPATPAVPGYPPPPGYPPAPGYSAPAGGQPATPAQAGNGEISLRKGARVDLAKGQKISLRKEDGNLLTLVRLGLGWDPLQGRGSIDLDASAVMYVGTQEFDTVAYTHLRSNDGSISHSGDNLTGDGAGDDEVITIDLQRIPPQVTSIAFVITSFQGQAFSKIRNAFCRMIDGTNNTELLRYDLGTGYTTTGMVMAALYRSDGIWKFQAIGQGIKARLPGKAAKLAVPFLPI